MESETLRLIKEFNPWYTAPFETFAFKRHEFKKLIKFLTIDQIITLVGLRRVGKSILMYQIIEYLIKIKKVNPKNIMYFLFDEIISKDPAVIEEIINTHEKYLKENNNKIYLFFDEIQFIDNWQSIIKRLYDIKKGKIKIFISGSSSINISSRSKESLAGRMFEIYIKPLNFTDFLKLKGKTIDKEFSLKDLYNNRLYLMDHSKELPAYTQRAGFPELIGFNDKGLIRSYILNSVLDKLIYKDLPKEFEIRRLDLLAELVKLLSLTTSSMFDISNLSNILKADKETIAQYLDYLIKSFLFNIIYTDSSSPAKIMRKLKKIFIATPSITLSYNRDFDAGKIAESLCFMKLFNNFEIAYYRDPQKREIDFILDHKIPLEVKYQNQIYPHDLKNLKYYIDHKQCKRAYVITKNKIHKEKYGACEIIFLPLWMFLCFKEE